MPNLIATLETGVSYNNFLTTHTDKESLCSPSLRAHIQFFTHILIYVLCIVFVSVLPTLIRHFFSLSILYNLCFNLTMLGLILASFN